MQAAIDNYVGLLEEMGRSREQILARLRDAGLRMDED
jgi:hypothetical protein